MQQWGENIKDEFDTVYFGGGTPSCFSAHRIAAILQCVHKNFTLIDPEITLECNPSSVSEEFFKQVHECGVNRISMGMQSAVDEERKALGRASSKNQVQNAVRWAKRAGITNISLDLMLGVPNQTMSSLDESLEFLIAQDITHISAYMLKVEEGTPFEKMKDTLNLADEDEVCDLYEYTIDKLSKNGFKQYEISNFSKGEQYQSRHNLKYWQCEQYLGIGPSAHSFINGKRFFYERDFELFVQGTKPTQDGTGGDESEYLMLGLRLNKGISFNEFEQKYSHKIDDSIYEKINQLQKKGLVELNQEGFWLTAKGFLISNSVISYIIY